MKRTLGRIQMKEADCEVLVLDDEASIRSGLEALLAAHGYRVRSYADSGALFQAGLPQVPACLLLDNQLGNGMTGVKVHQEIQDRGWDLPTIFLTAHWNVPSVVSAMRTGADGFLTKPFEPRELLQAVEESMQRARSRRREEKETAGVRRRAASLTAREREVTRLVVQGLLNKEIADQLKLALVTVKLHRKRAMFKLGARNSAELGRIAIDAGLCS